MKNLATALAFAALVSASPALADTMEAAFENTIVITYPSGGTSRYHFNRDGTFVATAPSGAQMRGNWTVEGDTLCFIPPSGDRMCSPFVSDKNVGDTWQQPATDGTIVTARIEAGRAAGHNPAAHGVVAETMQAAFANTVVITYPSGGASRFHFNADNTYTATTPTGVRTSGLWDLTADYQLCLTALSGDRTCSPFAPGKVVGDSWQQTVTDGTPVTITIEAGRD